MLFASWRTSEQARSNGLDDIRNGRSPRKPVHALALFSSKGDHREAFPKPQRQGIIM